MSRDENGRIRLDIKWSELIRLLGSLTAAGLLGGSVASQINGGAAVAAADDVARQSASEAKAAAATALAENKYLRERMDLISSQLTAMTDKQDETNKQLNQLIGALRARP